MKLLPNCRDVTRWVLEGEDRRLGWLTRARIRLHLQICAACPRFVAQVALMRQAMGRWKRYAEEEPPA